MTGIGPLIAMDITETINIIFPRAQRRSMSSWSQLPSRTNSPAATRGGDDRLADGGQEVHALAA